MLKARNLGMFYTDNDFLFRHLDIDVAPGDILAVLGPNARGKTTLLKTLAGLIRPREGTVKRGGTVGFVPQTRHNSVSYPVIDMVMMGRASTLRAWQTPGRRERDIAYGCLERVGIAQLADVPYSHLSGGQKQLVLIARAIATDPAVLLLDEPTSALDLKNQMRVLEICDVLARDGLGIVMTTHDPSHAALVATRVLAMLPDHTPRIGTAQDLLTSPTLSELYDTPIDVHEIHANGRRHLVATPIFSSGDTPATP